jgi:hypothetical protein
MKWLRVCLVLEAVVDVVRGLWLKSRLSERCGISRRADSVMGDDERSSAGNLFKEGGVNALEGRKVGAETVG